MASADGGIKTFLIADVRGYTSFTQRRGDEAAAELASRFAGTARAAIESGGGRLVELRGDEALAVFDSARSALRTAIELQRQFVAQTIADPSFPLPVGIGLDAGEAVPVDGGFRGGALNLAARLCSLAAPGEVLASREVTHLARNVDGIEYVARQPVRMKGLAEPVPVVAVRPDGDDPAHSADFRRALGHGAVTDRDSTRNPYKGLRAFEEADASDFFGREALTEHLVERLASTRFLAVVGPSGSGKSSVVRAGLVPALRAGALDGSEGWRIVQMFPGAYPLEELEAALLRSAEDAPASLIEQLEDGERGLVRALKRVLPDDGTEFVLVLDQLEEVFTLVDDEEWRVHFLAILERAVGDPHSRLRVVTTLRADFYDRPLLYSGFAELLRDYVEALVPLTADEFERAIARPAERAGVTFEPGLLAELVADVANEPGALPLLQYALTELYERREGNVMTRDAYRAIGGVSGALAGRAEELYDGLGETAQEAARQLFLRLVTLGEGSEDTRRRVDRTELGALEVDQDALEEALDVFGSSRLLSFDRDPRTGTGTVEVAHEALLREWGRLRRWIDTARDQLRLHRRLATGAREWAEADREPSFLLRGSQLAQYDALADESRIALTEDEREFVTASREAARDELRRQQRANRRLKALLAAAGVLLVVAVVAGIVALEQRSSAQHQATVALARELGARAVVEPRLDRAMLLATEGVNLQNSPETQGTLLSTLLRSPAAISTFSSPITDRPQQISLSPDGRTLAVVENSDFMRFYDTRTRRERVPALPNALHDAPTFSRDGKIVVLFRAKGPRPAPQHLEILDARTLRHLRWLPTQTLFQTSPSGYQSPLLLSADDRHAYFAWTLTDQSGTHDVRTYVDEWNLGTGALRSAAVNARGMFAARLAGGTLELVTDNRVLILDARSLEVRSSRTIRLPASSAIGLGALSPDGTQLAFGLPSGAVSFIDLQSGRVSVGSGETGAGVQGLGYSPTGHVMLSTDENGHVTVWNPRTAQVVETFTGHEDRVLGLTFSADGRTAYTCSLDGAIFAWDLSNTRRFGRSFAFKVADDSALPVPGTPPLAVSGDSRSFAMRLQALQVGVFSVSTLKQESAFTVPVHAEPPNAVDALAWSPRAPLVAVAPSDGSLQLWNVAQKPRLVRTLHGSPDPKYALFASEIVFSPDGSRVFEGGFEHKPHTDDGVAAAWRVSDGKLLWRIDLPKSSTDAVAISEDGQTLALSEETGDGKNHTQIVNASTGKVERSVSPLGDVIAAGFAADGTLETGVYEGIVQSWNTRTGKEEGRPLLADPAPVSSIAFEPGTDTFATGGGSGGFVKLWDAKTLSQIGSALPGSPGRWANAVFTPDGSQLVTIYDDGKGAVWPVSVAAWKAHACSVAGRNLTREEWSRFVTGRSYARVC